MKLKTKLSSGLGFLFFIIFTLIIFSVYYIDKISVNSGNILKDNYNSLVYVKNMNSAIDNIFLQTISNSQQKSGNADIPAGLINPVENIFEKNLNLERNNITEPNEREYVERLGNSYNDFKKLAESKDLSVLQSNELYLSYFDCRTTLDSIGNVNMQAIVEKNHYAKADSESKKMYMAIVAAVCLIVAFFYFWYFPFYVSNSISILSVKMKELMKKAGIDKEIKNNDESFIILESIEMLNKKLD